MFFLYHFFANLNLANLFAKILLLAFLALVVLYEALAFVDPHSFEQEGERDQAADEMVLVVGLLHFFLGEQDFDAAFALGPQPIGLSEFAVVEVDLPHKEQTDSPQIEALGVDELDLLYFKGVADGALLLDDLAQFLQQADGGRQQFGDGLGSALPASVDVVGIGEDQCVSLDEGVHLGFSEQQ